MATKSHNLSHPPSTTIKAEENGTLPPSPAPAPAPPSQPPVKGEPQELAAAAAAIVPILKNSDGATTLSPEFQEGLLKSVDELHSLSTVLHTFKTRWDELQKHLDFIQTAIQDLDPPSPNIENNNNINNLPPQQQLATAEAIVPKPTTQTPAPADTITDKAIVPTPTPTPTPIPAPAATNTDNATAKQSELEYLCQTMCSRGLRKYIITHLSSDVAKLRGTHLSSDVAKLRGEVTAALKIAPKPAKLVLECIGRFFLQGSKAYVKDSPMIPARHASVLALEFLLLSGCTEVEPAVKEEADSAAIAWRKRLISEGGVSKTNAVDSRGLLLLIGSFGIPNVFRNEEVRDLIRLSNPTEISDALRLSRPLLAKIPDIIEGMLKNGTKAAAVDIAFIFGLEDKFPPQEILTSFLRESKEAWKKTRRESQGSFSMLKEANKKHLAALKSVGKCLEDHKLDPLKFLPGWQISEKMINLEKDIADLDKKIGEKMISKRKIDELESSKLSRVQVEKRLRNANVSSLIATHGLQDQRTGAHVDSKISYDGLTPTYLFDRGLSGHGNSYYAASSVATSLPDSILGTMARSGSGMLAPRVGSAMPTGYDGVLSTSAYPGAHRDILADNVRPVLNNNYPSYGWPGMGDAAFSDRLIGQSFAGQPASIGISNLYGSSTAFEGFTGLPKSPSDSVANRTSASDLYQFADAVLDGESYYSRGPRNSGTADSVLPAHHSSYRY